MEDRPHTPKDHKDRENGGVLIGPKGFLVNPAKKGRTGKKIYLGGHIDHPHDPYDKIKEIATESRLYHQ